MVRRRGRPHAGGRAPCVLRAPMLGAQERDLGKIIAADAPLLLAASPYAGSRRTQRCLLQLTFRRACFGDAEAPRSREAFESAVDRGRAQLHSCLEEIAAAARGWFTEARAVRRALEDPRAARLTAAAEESGGHLRRLLSAAALEALSPDWLRQLPRYLKAEERRWQRAAARGAESAHIVARARELVGPPSGARQAGRRRAALDSRTRRIAQLDRRIPGIAVRAGTQNPGSDFRGAPRTARRGNRGLDQSLTPGSICDRLDHSLTLKRIP